MQKGRKVSLSGSELKSVRVCVCIHERQNMHFAICLYITACISTLQLLHKRRHAFQLLSKSSSGTQT